MYETRNCYEDILEMPHHVSRVHPPMPVRDRAAQFAPFAALTGHGEAIQETARRTEEQKELDESRRACLDLTLRTLCSQEKRSAVIEITYFVPDRKKSGGSYATVSGSIKKIEEYGRTLILTDGTRIPLDAITEIAEE